jgi:hypothetical protein
VTTNISYANMEDEKLPEEIKDECEGIIDELGQWIVK